MALPSAAHPGQVMLGLRGWGVRGPREAAGSGTSAILIKRCFFYLRAAASKPLPPKVSCFIETSGLGRERKARCGRARRKEARRPEARGVRGGAGGYRFALQILAREMREAPAGPAGVCGTAGAQSLKPRFR